jgi:hypothetical protein
MSTYNLEDSVELPPELLTRPPFGKINVWKDPSKIHVRCYIDMGERAFEDACTGVAIDASGSMQPEFGYGPFAKNKVREVAQVMCPYIARKADKDGGTTLIYWATGDPGEIQPHGFLTESQAQMFAYPPPKNYGKRTNLLPALKYFLDGTHPKSGRPFRESEFGMFIFVTNGAIEDLEPVKQYSTKLAQEIEAGSRKPVKLIIIGVGSQIDERQMEELDNLDTSTSQDLYFHRIASQMTDLSDIFIELVSEDIIIAQNGVIRDVRGTEIQNFRDTGVPALFEFDLPAGSTSFTLEVEGQKFSQALP